MSIAEVIPSSSSFLHRRTSISEEDMLKRIPVNALQHVSVKDFCNPFGPYQIQERVCVVVKQWDKFVAQPPNKFLLNLLKSRNYDHETVCAMNSEFKRYSTTVHCMFNIHLIVICRQPTPKQLGDYSTELVLAVRDSDLDKLKALHAKGIR
jgi:hypothetical protein